MKNTPCRSRLPENAELVASTPMMNEHTVPRAILARHMAPRGKTGLLEVTRGALRFVWEDTNEVLEAVPGHPIVIEPERYHHVSLTGPVDFTISFYRVPDGGDPEAVATDAEANRPGEAFL